MEPTANGHVWLDENGVAWVDATNTKVVEIVADKLAYGSSPEEIHQQHPHLSLSQIHAALSYYYDHQAELDADMERRRRFVEQTEASNPPLSGIRRRLRQMAASR